MIFFGKVEIIKEGGGRRFNPKIIDAFLIVVEDSWAESMRAAG